jgi:hypothetical protein
MNDPLDDLLRASAPEGLADDGFVALAMAAIDRAEREAPTRRRTAPATPTTIARAVADERRRHDLQARLWRWAIAGLAAGVLLVLVVMLASPGHATRDLAPSAQWYPLCALLAAGAIWIAWRAWRDV